jgi:hypothetical protein
MFPLGRSEVRRCSALRPHWPADGLARARNRAVPAASGSAGVVARSPLAAVGQVPRPPRAAVIIGRNRSAPASPRSTTDQSYSANVTRQFRSREPWRCLDNGDPCIASGPPGGTFVSSRRRLAPPSDQGQRDRRMAARQPSDRLPRDSHLSIHLFDAQSGAPLVSFPIPARTHPIPVAPEGLRCRAAAAWRSRGSGPRALRSPS